MKMRTKLFLMVSVAFLGVSVALGADSKGFKSSKAKAAQKKYEKASEKAKKEYDKKIAAAKVVYKKDLNKALKEAMKKGDLKEANKINEEIAEPKKAAEEEPEAKADTKNRLLYVSPGNSANIYLADKLIGKSSQWGQLIPIKVNLNNKKKTKLHIETHNTDGVSWILVDTKNKWYISGNHSNTKASLGNYNKEMTYSQVTTGMHWVNDSLYKRIDKEMRIPKPSTIAYKLTEPTNKETSITFEIIIDQKKRIKIR